MKNLAKADFGSVPVIALSKEGELLDYNPPAGVILGNPRRRSPFSALLAGTSRFNFYKLLSRPAGGSGWQPEIFELDETPPQRIQLAPAPEGAGSVRQFLLLPAPSETSAAVHSWPTRTLFELASGFVWELEAISGRLRFVSESVENFLGLSPEDMAREGGLLRALVYPADLARLTHARMSALRARSNYTIEYRLRHPGGSILWVRERAEVCGPRLHWFRGVTLDITRARLNEMSLAQEQRILRIFLDDFNNHFGPDGVLFREKRMRELMEGELIEVREVERRRIGCDLHDQLGQQLTGINLLVKSLEKSASTKAPELVQDIGGIHKKCQGALEYVRSMIRNLQPDVKEPASFPVRVRALLEELKGLFRVSGTFRMNSPVALNREQSDELFLIVQEAATNALKHGNASKIDVRLCRRGGSWIELTVENRGRAYRPGQAGVGLESMKARAERLSGVFELSPSPRGCRVVVRIPGIATVWARRVPSGSPPSHEMSG